jgi:hypothetical protein
MTQYDSAAEQAARDWLSLTDGGDARACWNAAASLFRDAVSPDDWSQALKAARGPLGPVVSRKVSGANPASELPGAPDGEYVVFEFDTSFANKHAATETVTPMKDTDGQWRVSGYFIR